MKVLSAQLNTSLCLLKATVQHFSSTLVHFLAKFGVTFMTLPVSLA